VGLGKKYFILFNTHFDKNREAPSDIRGIERIQYASNQELEAKISILLKQELPDKQGRSESAFRLIKSNIIEVLTKEQGIGATRISELVGEDKAIVQSVVSAS
jgi:predicted nucleotide-binding protein